MAKRANPDMSLEEFDQWVKLEESCEEIAEAAGEEGGPRLSLVPDPISVPLDFLPDSVELPAFAAPAPSTDLATLTPTIALDTGPCRTVGGWSADRQRQFIEVLAETGTVHAAAKAAGLSARGAYALRVRSPAFAAA